MNAISPTLANPDSEIFAETARLSRAMIGDLTSLSPDAVYFVGRMQADATMKLASLRARTPSGLRAKAASLLNLWCGDPSLDPHDIALGRSIIADLLRLLPDGEGAQ